MATIGTVNWTPAQRDAIYVREKSIAVSAAAGSGKTAVLTRRIIEKICDEDAMGDLSRILVVTFTKAAASELVSRISDALSEELAKNPNNKHIHAQSLLVSSAPISTIHSFCLDLIRTNFQKLNIPADFSAADDTEITLMMQSIAEELISDHFENELRQGEERIEDFAAFADTFGDISHTDKLSETVISLYKALSSTVDFLDAIEKYRLQTVSALENGFDGSPWERALREYLESFLLHYRAIYTEAVAHASDHDLHAKYQAALADDLSFLERLLYFVQNGGSYDELCGMLSAYTPMKLTGVRGLSGEVKIEYFKEARKDFTKECQKLSQTYFSYSRFYK